MAEKKLNARIVHKHDTEANWNLATNFIPKHGELIIYDTDATHPAVRFKIGDGIKNVNDLPFTVASITNAEIDDVCGTSLGEIISSIGYSTGTITAQFNTFISFTGEGGTGAAVGNTFTLNYTKIGNIVNIYGVVNSGNFTTDGSNLAIGIKFDNFSFTPAHSGENTTAGSVGLTGQFSAYLQYMYIRNNSYIMCVTSPYFIASDPGQSNIKRYETGQKFFHGYVNFSIPIV